MGLLLAGRAEAAPSFRTEQNLPELGLRVRILAQATPEPLAPVKTFPYTFTRGEEVTRRDLYDARELWFENQHAGQWRDGGGNRLILGRPTHRLPAVSSDLPHLAREDFEQAMAGPAAGFDPTNLRALADWVGSFAGSQAGEPEALRLPNPGLARAVYIPLNHTSQLAHAFQVQRRQPDGRAAPSPWFVALLLIADGTPKEKVRRDFEAQFLANVSGIPLAGSGAVGGVRARDLSVAATPAATNGAVHPSRLAARKSIANMKDWWFAEAHGYIFLSDIRGTTGKYLIRELQENLPPLRAAFARLVPPLEPAEEVSVVRIFEDATAYRKYVGQDIEWSSGVWMPMQRELVVLSQDREKGKTLEIILHEAFHQYLSHASGFRSHAMWFNEGHACFFECAQIDRAGRVTLPESGRVNWMAENLPAATALLPSLLRADREAFYGGTDETRMTHYATAWALIYFLQKGAPSSGLTRYAGILPAYLASIKASATPAQATATAFRDIDMERLQKDFADFWKRDRAAARRYDPLQR